MVKMVKGVRVSALSTLARHGVGSADHQQLTLLHGLITCRADSHRMEGRTACVLKHDRLSVRVDVAVAPLLECQQNRFKLASCVRQHVLKARRALGIELAFEDAGVLEFLQTGAHDIAWGARPGGYLLEAVVAVADLANDQQRVPFANYRQGVGDRANSAGRFGFWTEFAFRTHPRYGSAWEQKWNLKRH